MSAFRINFFATTAPEFEAQLDGLLAWDERVDESVRVQRTEDGRQGPEVGS